MVVFFNSPPYFLREKALVEIDREGDEEVVACVWRQVQTRIRIVRTCQ
jgi:hypothetical protein